MKTLFGLLLLGMMSPSFAVVWTYQVNTGSKKGAVRLLDSKRNRFDAAGTNCEVTPVTVSNNTEFRTLSCGVGASIVSTGGLCTQKGAKVASVQYAILNITGHKELLNVVVACRFE